MAADWLSASSQRDFPSADVYYRVQELLMTDLDPPRGWRLLQGLVRLASNDDQLWQIGSDAIPHMIRDHEELIGAELAHIMRTDSKCPQTYKGQMDVEFYEFMRKEHPADLRC